MGIIILLTLILTFGGFIIGSESARGLYNNGIESNLKIFTQILSQSEVKRRLWGYSVKGYYKGRRVNLEIRYWMGIGRGGSAAFMGPHKKTKFLIGPVYPTDKTCYNGRNIDYQFKANLGFLSLKITKETAGAFFTKRTEQDIIEILDELTKASEILELEQPHSPRSKEVV